MPTSFGPQLIGETEKTLVAILRRYLDGVGLTEPQWVTLRVAQLSGDHVDTAGLTADLADRTHFADAAELVDGLTARGLLRDGRLTNAGRELVTSIQAAMKANTASIWEGFPPDDVASTERVLNELIARARVVLA